MSIWTYLTASPCCTTNTNKHDNTTNKYYNIRQREREFSSQKEQENSSNSRVSGDNHVKMQQG